MIWKNIGKSVIGTSHTNTGKLCEDALSFSIITDSQGDEVLIAIASDGAGSANKAKEASDLVTKRAVEILIGSIENDKPITEAVILVLVETIYDELIQLAALAEESISEYSCTLLGTVVYQSSAVFFQIGDGAIIRDDGNDCYSTIWWPHNGEYVNTTSFITDDNNFSNLKITIISETINEIAILTDGLQHLSLNNETSTVYQPFFTGLFKWLRYANKQEEVEILNNKLEEYLCSEVINSRTDDDKTLFLATRIHKWLT